MKRHALKKLNRAMRRTFTLLLSALVLGWLPGFLGEIPFLQVGLPAVLSIYFDLFSGCIQAYIFAMLTMLNISGGYPADAIEERRKKRQAKLAANR